MSNVNLAIAGREYTVACSPGEEPHVTMLGEMISSKLSTLPNTVGQSEVRRFLYAALLLADEVHDLRAEPRSDCADKLEALAERLEGLAEELEAQDSGSSGGPGREASAT